MPKKKTAVLPHHIANQLRGTRRPFGILSAVRPKLSVSQMLPLARAYHICHIQGRIAFDLFPTTVDELRRDDRDLEHVSLEHEVWWAIGLFSSFASRINRFLECKRAVEGYFWRGEYKLALERIAEHDSVNGVSMWSIEVTQFLLQFADGLSAQKKFTGSIRSQRTPENSLSYIVFHSSVRNENTTQILTFVEDMSERIRATISGADFQKWLIYRICDRWPDDAESIATILRSELASSLIDVYETVMHIGSRLIAFENALGPLFSRAITSLEGIDDVRIQRISARHSNVPLPAEPFTEHARAVDDAYYDQNFAQVSSIFHDAVTRGFVNAEIVDKHTRSLTLEREPSSTDEELHPVIRDLKRLYSRHFEVDGFLSLAKTALNTRFTSIPSCFSLSAARQVDASSSDSSRQERVVALNQPVLGLGSAVSLSPPSERVRLDYEHRSVALDIELSRYMQIGDSSVSSGTFAFAYQKASDLERYVQNSDWDIFFRVDLTKLLEHQDNVLNRRVKRLLVEALMAFRPLHEAVSFIVESLLGGDEGIKFQLPILECANRMDKGYRKEFANDIKTSILLDFAARIDGSKEATLAYSYEDFLVSRSLERASQFATIHVDLPHDQLVYFLRHVCRPEILERSLAFDGTTSVENERILICSLLASMDPSGAKEYEDESKKLTQRQIIRRGVRQVEESKIYIDTAGLRRWAEKNLGESFARFKALRDAGMEVGDKQLAEAIRASLEANAYDQSALALPANEAIDVLVLLLQSLVGQYLKSQEYGLDYYLSMRVRHGAFSGQLRAPLETQHLVTQRSRDTAEYKSNTYWRSRLFQLNAEQWAPVDSALREFSKKFDDLVQDYATRYLQIWGEDKPEGLFYLTVTNVLVLLATAFIRADSSLESLLNEVLSFIDGQLDQVLLEVRAHIDQHLATALTDLTVSLETTLEDLNQPSLFELQSAIRGARTSLVQALGQLKSWFQRVELPNRPEWSFEDVVRIGLECVTKMHESFQPDLNIVEDGLPGFMDLIAFSDIFYIIFDNIRLHSGLTRPAVTVAAWVKGESIYIRVTNEVGTAVVNDQNTTHINSIRERIREGGYGWGARREGGSGLMKLRQRIGLGREGSSEFSFGFQGDTSFTVECEVPVIAVRRKEHDAHSLG